MRLQLCFSETARAQSPGRRAQDMMLRKHSAQRSHDRSFPEERMRVQGLNIVPYGLSSRGRSSTIHYIFNTNTLLCTPRYHQTSQKKPLYKQYKGIRFSWQDPVPMGIFMCLLPFNSTFNLILAFNSIHLLLVCTLLDICEDPHWVNHTWPHSLKFAQLIIAGYKPDCHQERNHLRKKSHTSKTTIKSY